MFPMINLRSPQQSFAIAFYRIAIAEPRFDDDQTLSRVRRGITFVPQREQFAARLLE